MNICLAQIESHKGDIQKNIEKHKEHILESVKNNADLICFPELSITGYEPELAKELATTQSDVRFDVFQSLSNEHNITICIGVPTTSNGKIYVSMIIFQPNKERQTYSKQYLHSDEKPYFVESCEQLLIECKNKILAPAICYESLIPKHFEKAKNLGIDIYLVSVAKPEKNIRRAYSYFPKIAKQHSINVLMINSVGYSDNFIAKGQSAIWDTQGELKASADSNLEEILIVEL